MTRKLVLAVLFGGRSSEHSISCATAGGVLGAIDRERYEVIPVGITREGACVLERDDPEAFSLAGAALPEVADNGTRVHWPEDAASRTITVTAPDGAVLARHRVDVVFPTLHGRFGEDGTIQGMLELLDLPYVGNGVLASALGMDKHFTKTVLQAAGVDVAAWVTVSKSDLSEDPDAWQGRIRDLGLPVFVKPARAGSSVGVSKVSSWDELPGALEAAFAHDARVLVEEAVSGRELECAVLAGERGDAPRVSVAGEIVLTGRDFYDFDAKYRGAPGVELVCPAPLTPAELAQMQGVASRAFTALDGAGLARIDFFFTGTRFIVNEVNTMPGFTPISMFPRCWQASGLDYPGLIDELIRDAWRRDPARERVEAAV